MSPSFADHVDLLDLHGRAAVATLQSLSPDAAVPPAGATAKQAAEEHWATLEIWSWSLAHPGEHWGDRAEPVAPASHRELVGAISAEVDRLVAALRDSGPDVSLDYFGRPGTTAEVARLLAFEAITAAHDTALAAGRPAPILDPVVANDGVAQGLEHWESPQLETTWRPQPVAIRATDTRAIWHVSLPQTKDDLVSDFRLTSAASPAAVVEGTADNLLWWLRGHHVPDVSVTGADGDVRAVKSAFLQPVEPAPRRRRWFG